MSAPEARGPEDYERAGGPRSPHERWGPPIGHATTEADCLPSALPKHLTESGGACRQPDHGTFQGCTPPLGVGIAPAFRAALVVAHDGRYKASRFLARERVRGRER